MATPSIGRFVAVAAKVEGSYNDGTTTAAGGTDDVTIIDSSDPVGLNEQVITVQPHRSSFTQNVADMAGRSLWDVSLQGLVQGSGAAGAVANGFTGMSALWQAAGFTQTLNAGTSIVFTPSTYAAQKSVALKIETHGGFHSILGAYGDLEIFGSTALGKARWMWRGTGLYNATPTLATLSGVTAPDRAESILGATAIITPSDGSAYNLAGGFWVDSFRYRVNAQPVPVEALNATTGGVARLLYVDRAPTLDLTLVCEMGTTNLDYADLYGDKLHATVRHALSLTWGTTPNQFAMSWPTMQLRTIGKPTNKNGYRVQTLSYKVMHATAESESTFTIS